MGQIIAVDFDGTLFDTEWPSVIGAPNIDLINWLKGCRAYGDRIILWTCRCGKDLEIAVDACAKQGLIFDAVNENLPDMIEKFGGDSRKIFADIYVDDKMACGNLWRQCRDLRVQFEFFNENDKPNIGFKYDVSDISRIVSDSFKHGW